MNKVNKSRKDKAAKGESWALLFIYFSQDILGTPSNPTSPTAIRLGETFIFTWNNQYFNFIYNQF